MPPPRYEVDIDQARHLYWDLGMTLKEVAVEFQVSGSLIQKRFVEAGVPMRPRYVRAVRANFVQAEILVLLDRGYTERMIDEYFGWAHSNTSKRLRRMGVAPRRRPEAVRLGIQNRRTQAHADPG